VACHPAIRVVPDLADYLPCHTLLPGGFLGRKNAAHPADQTLSRMAGILNRCRHKPYLRTDLTFVSIDMALY